jgi:hypothetical protein
VDGQSCCHNCFSVTAKGNRPVDRHCSECEVLRSAAGNKFEAFVCKGLKTVARMYEVCHSQQMHGCDSFICSYIVQFMLHVLA